ncbi:MAG: mechanosensitive ion channel [Campylobacterales bacterium]|nr:mechanosensitive ion channel [Campylobacterales bacterium]
MKQLIIILVVTLKLFSETNSTNNIEPSVIEQSITEQNEETLRLLNEQLQDVNNLLKKDSLWLKKYANFTTYQKVQEELDQIKKEIKLTNQKKDSEAKQHLEILITKENTLTNQLELLSDYKESPFKEFIKPQEITNIPEVENPFSIISALSFIKMINQRKEFYQQNYESLNKLILKLEQKKDILTKIVQINHDEKFKTELTYSTKEVDDFKDIYSIFGTTISLYTKRVDEIVLNLTNQIKEQIKQTAYILSIILILFIISILIKVAIKKYVTDNEKFYVANKVINVVTFILILLVLLFSYLENVTYLVTVLGFASAGIAIAMKDIFMSFLGWMVIVVGGTIHIGDRIKASKENMEFVGDVLDISLLRITLFEDVTLTSYTTNRRAGRIIFIPNNYIFTHMIANYSHSGMKTVWDGIDINITFDSNHKKAVYIVKEIVKRYSKGYTDITRKQLNKLRDRYNLRNTNVEPRIFAFVEPYGIRISAWYLTNSYATLTLRSSISLDILDSFKEEDDIKIAYPTQAIQLAKLTDNLDSTEFLKESKNHQLTN